MTPRIATTSSISELIASKMRQERVPEPAVEAYLKLYQQVEQGRMAFIPESDIMPVAIGEIPKLSGIESYAKYANEVLPQTAVLKLNGGLGTTMGLNIPKSLIEVKNGLTFLDIAINQLKYLNATRKFTMPLLLMNSFFTDAEIHDVLARMADLPRNFIHTFAQDKFPKILVGSYEPVSHPEEPDVEWNPAGHGDLFVALDCSGLLDKLVNQGYRYLFVSNIDNLGAQIDEAILGYFAAEKLDFLMEVTERTHMDRKGGHLARLRNGNLSLRESAQCSESDKPYFSDIRRHRFFNTNNIWINLPAIQQFLKNKRNLELPPVVSRKKLIAGDAESPDVLHIEQALGSSISCFGKSAALNVPRTRFAPVKSCEDLLVLWSDNFALQPDFRLKPNAGRTRGPISISLDPAYYSRFDFLKSRFPCGAPSLVDCESFSIRGDVRFGCNVVAHGRVSVTNARAEQAVVRDGTDLGGDLVFGSP